MKNKARISHFLSIALFLATLASSAGASPIIDGMFDPNEGYTLGRYVDFTVQKVTGTFTGGQLWTHVDQSSGDLYLAFIQPKYLVDNTYGANSIGWASEAPSGKHHNFSDIIRSDAAQFVFYDALGAKVLDIDVDYFSASGGEYACLGATGGDGSVNFGSAGNVLEFSSSMDYNFNTLGYILTATSPATDDDYTDNSQYSGWVYEYIYELRISGATFGSAGYGELTIPLVHDSPNKLGGNKVYTELDGRIPEPATLSLLGLGALGMLIRRKR